MDRKPKAYVVDIDGTISDSEMSYLYQVEIANDDWSWFTSRIPHFEEIPVVAEMVRLLRGKNRILYVTVRSDLERLNTLSWLAKHDLIHNSELYMRPDSSRGLSVSEEKRRHLISLLDRYEIVGAIDDNESCLSMFREYGIPTFHFKKGDA